ncbi:MAG TPA: phage holin family protein [Candidatus Angelobacter sp.]|nr:phage holin family protein [Candidatus Angelobacter sp.]
MHNEKSIGAVLAETKAELRDFFDTRLQILRAELKDKVSSFKQSVPLMIVAGALLLAGWLALTFALVALIQAWLQPSPYAWMWAALIIAVLYGVGGIAFGWYGYSEIRSVGVTPKRTLEVLKQDQAWIQNEARTA